MYRQPHARRLAGRVADPMALMGRDQDVVTGYESSRRAVLIGEFGLALEHHNPLVVLLVVELVDWSGVAAGQDALDPGATGLVKGLEDLLSAQAESLWRLSDVITSTYFSHSLPPRQLSPQFQDEDI